MLITELLCVVFGFLFSKNIWTFFGWLFYRFSLISYHLKKQISICFQIHKAFFIKTLLFAEDVAGEPSKVNIFISWVRLFGRDGTHLCVDAEAPADCKPVSTRTAAAPGEFIHHSCSENCPIVTDLTRTDHEGELEELTNWVILMFPTWNVKVYWLTKLDLLTFPEYL